MRSGQFWCLMICSLLLAACNLVAPPQPVVLTVQPTVTAMPTRVAQDATPSPTMQASARPTQSSTPRATATALPTQTDTPPPTPASTFTAIASSTTRPTTTQTPSVTPANTARPTNTATQTPSVTPTARPINTATAIPTNTPVPTVTPIPPPATPTRPPTNTPTPLLSPTPAPTVTPAPTATSTIDATRIANGLRTQAALLTLEARPSWTAVPQSSATNTLAPTQNATPTLVTATPGGGAITSVQSPMPSTPQPVVGAPTTTPLPTLVPPTVFITPVPPPLSFAPGLNNSSLAQGNFNVPPDGFIFNGVRVGGSVVRFAANPAFPGSYARTDAAGLLYILKPDSTEEIMVSDRVTDIVWSSDGQLAYTIYTEAVSKNNGVHVWSNGQDIPVQTDCPSDQHDPCGQVSDKVVNNWRTIRMEWSSDNRYILTTNIAQTTSGARLALAMSPLGKSPTIAPYLWFFSSGHFLSDNRIVVSGENVVGEAPAPLIVGIVSPSDEGRLFNPAQMEILLESEAQGVWVEAVVQTANGDFVGFGCTPCNATSKGALALGVVANGTWTPLTQPIGSTSPQRILWSPDRRQAVVTVDGQQFLVDVATRGVTGLASAP